MLASTAKTVTLVSFACLVFNLSVLAESRSPRTVVRRAAQSWISFLDEGRYVEAWDSFSEEKKKQLTQEDWLNGFDVAMRKSLGKPQQRKIMYLEIDKSNLNKAQVNFGGSFERRPGVGIFESLSLVRNSLGEWMVSDYSCRVVPRM